MAVTVTWRSGDSSYVINASEYIGFFGLTFGTSIAVGAYQDFTCATDSSGSVNYGDLLNVKFIDPTHGDWGYGTEVLSNIEEPECTLRITVSSGSMFNLQAARLIIWDGGSDDTVAPSNMVVKGFEYGDTAWTTLSGSMAPLVLTPQMSEGGAMSYDYYVSISATPSEVGIANTVGIKIYAEYY